MADYYISKSGTSGGDGSIGDPVQTTAQVKALGAAQGDTVIFRAGTYDSELNSPGNSTYGVQLTGDDAFNVKGYAGETVNFQPATQTDYLFAYVSTTNSSGSEATVTFENINFLQAADGSGCDCFMRLDTVNGDGSAHKINWIVKDCTFTQTESQHSLILGAIRQNSRPDVGQSLTIDNCTFTLSHEHVFQVEDFVDTFTFKNNTVTIAQPADATTAQVDKMFFVNGRDNVSRVTQVTVANNDVTVTLDDINIGKEIFQFDYVNNVNFINNSVTLNKHASQSSVGGPLGHVVRFYQGGVGSASTHRELKTCVISGNTIIRNDVRGDTFDFNGSSGGTAFSTSSVTCTYNKMICTDPLLRTNDNDSHFLKNVENGQCNSWVIKYNYVKGSQDAIWIRDAGAGPLAISHNIFEDVGEDAAGSASTPKAIYTRGVGSSSNRTEIKGNIFDFVQKGTAIQATEAGQDTHCDIVDNTFISRTANTGGVSERILCWRSATDTGSQHAISGNRYMSFSNWNSTKLAVNNGSALSDEAAVKGVDTTATFTNMSSGLVKEVNENGIMAKSLGL